MSNQGDIVVILSNELIADVLETYFNKEMFKSQVKVVDLQASENGYAFTLSLNHKHQTALEKGVTQTRDSQGRFKSKSAINHITSNTEA